MARKHVEPDTATDFEIKAQSYRRIARTMPPGKSRDRLLKRAAAFEAEGIMRHGAAAATEARITGRPRAVRGPMPAQLEPQLATRADAAPAGMTGAAATVGAIIYHRD